jgi:hypothetical protein
MSPTLQSDLWSGALYGRDMTDPSPCGSAPRLVLPTRSATHRLRMGRSIHQSIDV